MSNPVIDAIKTRRSTRHYLDKPVPKEIIEQILAAGQLAPSGMNSQPWRFVVVTDPEVRKQLTAVAKENAKPFYDDLKQKFPERAAQIDQRFATMVDPIFYEAPVIIFMVCEGSYSETAAGLAAENMFLAAKSLGINSCWVDSGKFALENSDIRKQLGMMGEETRVAPLLFGYADGEPEMPPRKELDVTWV